MEPEKVVYSISTSFRRRPESIDIKMLEIPDQARNDRQKTFYDAILSASGIHCRSSAQHDREDPFLVV